MATTRKDKTHREEKDHNDADCSPPTFFEKAQYFVSPLLILTTLLVDLKYQNPYIVVWIFQVLVPILDYLLPLDRSNLPEGRIKHFEKASSFTAALYFTWAGDFAVYFCLLYRVSQGLAAQTPGTFLLYAYSYAQIGAINAGVGHELLHRRALVHKVCGTLAFSKMLYSHYFIQHVRSHHKLVATAHDASTGRLNESFYAYFNRAIVDGVRVSWDYEAKRLA